MTRVINFFVSWLRDSLTFRSIISNNDHDSQWVLDYNEKSITNSLKRTVMLQSSIAEGDSFGANRNVNPYQFILKVN